MDPGAGDALHDQGDDVAVQPEGEGEIFVAQQNSIALDFQDARLFAKSPAPLGMTVHCRIERRSTRSGSYRLYVENPALNSRRFLLASQKANGGKAADYVVSLDRHDVADTTTSWIAKVRSNFVGTTFVGYDVEGSESELLKEDNALPEVVGVYYDANILGMRGPRKMTVVIPSMTSTGSRLLVHRNDPQASMLARAKAKVDCFDITELSNKPPHWNEALQSFTLDFHGRATMASVKNFQLVHADDTEYIVMQMGKVESNAFTCDYRYPLSAQQAFCIALSSFHGKLVCE